MTGQRNFFAIEYIPLQPKGGLTRAAGGYLRYLQYRPHDLEPSKVKDVQGILGYIAYRDAASPQRRMFDATKTVGDRERLALLAYIERSVEDTLRRGGARSSTNNRAAFDMVISPEDARGLDLRRLARAGMSQLERDAGTGGLPPWIAAEHRNTDHPHVQIVMAGRREVSPGVFRTVLITKARKVRMEQAMLRDMTLQREERAQIIEQALAPMREPRSTDLQFRTPCIRTVRGDGRTAVPVEVERIGGPARPGIGESAPDRERRAPSIRTARVDGQTAGAAGPEPLGIVVRARAAHRVAQITAQLARHYQREADAEAQRLGWSSEGERQRHDRGRERVA